MLALIDGDIVVYRVGFTTEDVDSTIACLRVQEVVAGILSAVNADSYKIFLTEDNDPTAFRKRIYPEYKAHRIQPRPKWYKEIRDFLQTTYDAEVCHEIEADDALGIEQCKEHPTAGKSVICSIDKDLKQIPGLHYNFVKQERDSRSILEGLYYFYTQLLVGDSSDNIKGVWKVGPKKAEVILEDFGHAAAEKDISFEQELFNRVRETYSNDEEMLMNGRVLWIWKEVNDDWKKHWDALSTNS